MFKFDRIKSLVSIVLIISVLIPFIFLGKNDPVTRWVSAMAIIAWLLTMFLVNRKKKDRAGGGNP